MCIFCRGGDKAAADTAVENGALSKTSPFNQGLRRAIESECPIKNLSAEIQNGTVCTGLWIFA